MVIVYLALGSNIDKEKNLKRCIDILQKKFKVLKVSSVYVTSPVGYKSQPNFYNRAIEIETDLPPKKLFGKLMKIEKQLKRVRKKKNHPRTIDIDILFYGDKILKLKNLIIPHPRLHKRSFVLVPLNEIAPKFKHPVLKKTISELLKRLKGEGVLRSIRWL